MITEQLDIFFFKLNKYLVTKQDGFYRLPYVGNSPEVMVKSLSGIPYNNPDPTNNIIHTNNPFSQGTCEYQEIEPGLWLFYNDLIIKKNVSYKKLHNPKFKSDYYSLAFRIDASPSETPNIDGHKFELNHVLFSKPMAPSNNYFYKNSKIKSLIVFFSEEWITNNTKDSHTSFYHTIKYFLHSDRSSLHLPNFAKNGNLDIEIAKIFANSIGNANRNKLNLKIKTLELLQIFMFQDQTNLESKTDIEEVLMRYIYQPFPGIEYLSREIGISSTKLKTEFRTKTGQTLFQYFQKQQMTLAKELIEKTPSLIKNVSYEFGYENSSKFAAAFKKHHGYLPSLLKSKQD